MTDADNSGAEREASGGLSRQATTWEFAANQAAQQILTSYEKQRDVFVAARARSGDHLAWIGIDVERLKEGLFDEDAAPIEPWGYFVSTGVAVLAHIESTLNSDGHERLEHYVSDVCTVLAAKQHDYGHENIAAFGARGITVRLSDKLARLRNLERRQTASNESVEDTWLDLFGYAVIGVMWEDETFGLSLAADAEVQVPLWDPKNIDAAVTAAEERIAEDLEVELGQRPKVGGQLAEWMARHPSAQSEAEPSPSANETVVSYTLEDERFVRRVIAEDALAHEHFVLGIVQDYCDGLEFEHAVRELVSDELGHAAEARREVFRHGHGTTAPPVVPYAPSLPPLGKVPDQGRDVA